MMGFLMHWNLVKDMKDDAFTNSWWWWWWWWIVFVEWLNSKIFSALFPPGIIIKGSHHHKPATNPKQDLNLWKTWVQVLKYYSSDNHNSTIDTIAVSNSSGIMGYNRTLFLPHFNKFKRNLVIIYSIVPELFHLLKKLKRTTKGDHTNSLAMQFKGGSQLVDEMLSCHSF